MVFTIETVDGKTIEADLVDVGNVFPDDDVIYINGTPAHLSTATPVINAMPELLTAAKNALDWFNAYEFGALDKPDCEEITTQLDAAIAAADPDWVC